MKQSDGSVLKCFQWTVSLIDINKITLMDLGNVPPLTGGVSSQIANSDIRRATSLCSEMRKGAGGGGALGINTQVLKLETTNECQSSFHS